MLHAGHYRRIKISGQIAALKILILASMGLVLMSSKNQLEMVSKNFQKKKSF